MNILAHLQLANFANSSIIGNAAADFVRGDPYQQYPHIIADGIMMHRRLDKLIDGLSDVKYAKSLFRPETKRVALIALDIIWDHFLSKHWQYYSPDQNISSFSAEMKNIIMPEISLFSDKFSHFMNHLWQGEWLNRYSERDFINHVLIGMANRRPKLNALKETLIDFEEHYLQLEQLFIHFYPILIQQAKSQTI